MSLSDIETYSGEGVAVSESHEEYVAGSGTIWVGGGEETCSRAGGVEGRDLVVCDFLDRVRTELARRRDRGFDWNSAQPFFETYTTSVSLRVDSRELMGPTVLFDRLRWPEAG